MSITLKLTEDISLKFIEDDYFNTKFIGQGGKTNKERNLYIKDIVNCVPYGGDRRLQTVSSLVAEGVDIGKCFLENIESIDFKKGEIMLGDHDDEGYEAYFGEGTYEILR